MNCCHSWRFLHQRGQAAFPDRYHDSRVRRSPLDEGNSNNTTGMQPDSSDSPLKENDDTMDETRYALNFYETHYAPKHSLFK